MNLNQRIELLIELGQRIVQQDPMLESAIHHAFINNSWFTIDNIQNSLNAIAHQFLEEKKLLNWAKGYNISESTSKTLAIVMAGNIPMVGFHDLLCGFISGYHTKIKCSSKDEVLIPALISIMESIDPYSKTYFQKVDRLKGFDAVIATGGNTAGVHFEYYFSKYPHIIRKNRSSVAILDGSESKEEIHDIGADIFDYFGLGCRSISKIYVPQDFNTDRLFEGIVDYKGVIHHNKYKNNYDYNSATLILTKQKFLTNDFLILQENNQLASRIACLHYERYSDVKVVTDQINKDKERLQCVSSKNPLDGWQHIPLGQCQRPSLDDYADMIDTMDFLINQY